MRAVVDTNILVSGLLSPSGPPAQVLAAITAGRLRLVVCAQIVAEYRAVLARPRLRIRPGHAAGLVQLLEQTADWVAVPPYTGTPLLPDPGDWPFVAAARFADCPVITGNLKHFPAALGAQAMSAREWVLASGW